MKMKKKKNLNNENKQPSDGLYPEFIKEDELD